MKDAVATMGGLLPDDAGGRDAVHVAVFSAVSDNVVTPGEDVSVVGQKGADVEVSLPHPDGSEPVGIVDPFIQNQRINPGKRFWVYLYPRTITGLSHQWKHPAFPDNTDGVYVTPAAQISARQWLENYLMKDLRIPLNKILEAAENPGKYIKYGTPGDGWADGDDYYTICIDGDYFHVGGTDAHGDVPSEFWEKVEAVLGHKIKKKPEYFSCSC